MDVELRRIGPEDWALLKDVRLRALADSPDAFAITLAESADKPDEVWQERAATPGPTYVALADGRAVAMGGAFPADGERTAYVWGMWTAPAARGRGHASRILDELLAWCRGRALEVRLHVTEGNEGARRLYLARGFRPTGAWEPLREGSPLQVEEMRWVPDRSGRDTVG